MTARALNTAARRGVACALALLCLGVVGACGSGSDSAQRLLDQALHPAERLHSGRFTLTIAPQSATAAAGAIHVVGTFQALGSGRLPRFGLDLTVPRGGASQSVGATSTGDRVFLTLRGTTYAAPPALVGELQRGYAQGAGTDGGVTGARGPGGVTGASGPAGPVPVLGLDPQRWLTRPRRAGTAVVDGVRTVHIRAQIDAMRFSGDLGRLLAQASTLAALGGLPPPPPASAASGGSADVYVGASDHLLRRLAVRARGANPVAALLSFAQLNQPQMIAAPAGARPLASLLSALSGARR
jgi:hypothetical protein